MALSTGVWGIDIGQCALKAVRLDIVDGAITATAFDYVEHPKILSQPDADPDQLTREALEQFLSRNTLKGDKVAISVPGQSGLARFVKLPPVEEKKISDIVKFEAKQQIPFPLEEVVWDFQKIGQGTVTDGFAIDTEVGLFAMKRDMINRFLSHFNGVGVEVHYVQMAPLALCNYVTYDQLKMGGPGGLDAPEGAGGPKKKCVVALDIGTDSSNLIITDGARIIWQRPIPLGGNHFTRALTKEMKLTFAKAEHLKRNAAKSPELPNILKALKPVLTDFVGEVQRSLGYFTNTHRDAAVNYMIGLGSAFRLPGLQKYLGDKLQLEIKKPAKYERLGGEAVTNSPVFVENVLSFPVAYGLALQALDIARLRTNLLPPEITFERKIRAKKPWAVAAAAMLMVGTAVWAYGESVPYAAVQHKSIEETIKADQNVIKRAGDVKGQITAKEQAVEATKIEVQSIISGQEERINWIKLNEFVNKCLPMPGPPEQNGNLNDDRKSLWFTEPGIKATKLYQRRLAEGLDPAIGFDDATRANLATVDIEGIYTRFTPDLKAFFDRAKEESFKQSGVEFHGMLEEDKKAPPEGPGWVVEVRGTTYYSPDKSNVNEYQFLNMTLLRHLQVLGRAKFDQPNPALIPLIGKDRPEKDDAVIGRVSHVFLYDVYKDPAPKLDEFLYLKHPPLIDILIPQTASASASGPLAGPMSAPVGIPAATDGGSSATGAPEWRPLLTGGGGNAASGPAGPGPSGAAPGGPRPGLLGSGEMGPGGPSGGASSNPYTPIRTSSGSTTPSDTKSGNVKPRFEFLIVFVWKEPTPSDKLMSK